MTKVAFQGTLGSYSEEALLNFFKTEDVSPSPFNHSPEVGESVRSGDARYGILPVENSIVGNVTLNLDLIYEHNLKIFGEIYLNIRHCLLALPGTKIEKLDSVMSHPIALSQCSDFLAKNYLKKVPTYDTAGSAIILNDKNDHSIGVIASRLAAKYYKLDILNEEIANTKNNFTRFLVFSSKTDDQVKQADKMSIAFTTKHHPGALLNCLQEFKKFDLNLTKIESRPIPNNPFSYRFFVDFLVNPESKKVDSCLEALQADALEVKVLGAYMKAKL